MLRLQLSRRLAAAVLLAGLAAGPALALDPVFSEDGLAIRGYDPVAYFNDGRPVEGKDEFTYSHEGTVWRFATAANRDAFRSEEHTSELQSLMRISYAVFCLKKKKYT